jgi:phosphatidylglycerol:prolipoprotein diacylglycerol transferase
MKPILFTFGNGYYIHSGHLTLFLGGLAALVVLALELKRTGERPEEIYGLLLLLYVSAILGARILYCLDFEDKYHYSLLDVLRFWKGGLALHGGGILAFVTFVLYVSWRQLDFWRVADLFAPPGAVFVFCARIGCILTGCCYGKQCGPGFPLAMTFKEYSANAPKEVPLYPTQPLFAAAALVVFVTLWMKRKKKRFDGEIALLGTSLFSLFAFLIEFLRGDLRVLYQIGGLTLSQNQIIGAAVFTGVTGIYVFKRKKAGDSHAIPGVSRARFDPSGSPEHTLGK